MRTQTMTPTKLLLVALTLQLSTVAFAEGGSDRVIERSIALQEAALLASKTSNPSDPEPAVVLEKSVLEKKHC